MNPYKIVTFWSEKDKAWIGRCPDFEGLVVVAGSRAAANQEAEAALANFIEIYNEEKIELPKPTLDYEYSGQVRLRISKYAHQKAAEQAEAEGVSLNAFLSAAVEARLAVQQYQKLLLDEISKRWEAATVNVTQNEISITSPTTFYFGQGTGLPMLTTSIGSVGGMVNE